MFCPLAGPSDPAARRAHGTDKIFNNLLHGSCKSSQVVFIMLGCRVPCTVGHPPAVLPQSGGGHAMLPVVILSLGLAPADPGESPAALAAWLDGRLGAAWHSKGLSPRPPVGDDVFLRRAYLE